MSVSELLGADGVGGKFPIVSGNRSRFAHVIGQ